MMLKTKRFAFAAALILGAALSTGPVLLPAVAVMGAVAEAVTPGATLVGLAAAA